MEDNILESIGFTKTEQKDHKIWSIPFIEACEKDWINNIYNLKNPPIPGPMKMLIEEYRIFTTQQESNLLRKHKFLFQMNFYFDMAGIRINYEKWTCEISKEEFKSIFIKEYREKTIDKIIYS